MGRLRLGRSCLGSLAARAVRAWVARVRVAVSEPLAPASLLPCPGACARDRCIARRPCAGPLTAGTEAHPNEPRVPGRLCRGRLPWSLAPLVSESLVSGGCGCGAMSRVWGDSGMSRFPSLAARNDHRFGAASRAHHGVPSRSGDLGWLAHLNGFLADDHDHRLGAHSRAGRGSRCRSGDHGWVLGGSVHPRQDDRGGRLGRLLGDQRSETSVRRPAFGDQRSETSVRRQRSETSARGQRSVGWLGVAAGSTAW